MNICLVHLFIRLGRIFYQIRSNTLFDSHISLELSDGSNN